MFSASKTAAPVSGSFQVSNSLRFRSSASAYLNRTPSVAGNQQKFTFSTWLKRGALSNYINFFGAGNTLLEYYSDNTLYMNLRSGATNYVVNYANVFRDPSAWYHIVWSVDTTQATASDRAKIYVNGVQLTAAGSLGQSWCPQNTNLAINSTVQHYIGGVGGNYFDGYMAEVNFIDGQALTPSSFGSINATTGVWQPARYTGSYGTNGFYLKFNNGTSTTTLGNDSSGNNNNWTTNNISLTAGSTYDWMIDSPTSYAGSSYGVGNYAVLNPLAARSSAVISSANLAVTTTGGNVYSPAPSSIAVSSGKWYFEALLGGGGTVSNSVGIALSTLPMSTNSPSSIVNVTGTYAYINPGWSSANGTLNTSYGAAWTLGDVIGVALDLTAGTLTYYKNGVSQGVATTGLSGSYVMFVESYASTNFNVNFGQRPFSYTPPTGFKSLCTQNLPAPAIYNGANHMAATTYTGTGSSLSISNSVNSASFQPDLVWIKSRSAATDHALYDVIRGTQNRLESNTTDAAVAADNGLTAFGSAGFTVNTLAQVNTSAATYVGWQWKAGGTAVTNTAGSITSQVSANPTAGFSVVTYTGNGTAGATVGHGLGVAPSMVITKCRSASGGNWAVYHISNGATGTVWLNVTNPFQTTSLPWNNTTPTSNVFSIGSSNTDTNVTGGTMVAYCFAAIAGYSAFGSYTGNGSTDGPFVYTGFRPRFVLIKITSASTDGWMLQDTTRFPYNVITQILAPNSSGAESTFGTAFSIDVLSNGFKLRNSGSWQNGSGSTYIYAAFAENPFQNSLAR